MQGEANAVGKQKKPSARHHHQIKNQKTPRKTKPRSVPTESEK
jgi:hypothetical protein